MEHWKKKRKEKAIKIQKNRIKERIARKKKEKNHND